MSAAATQSRGDREYILKNLPDGTRRVQVILPSGKQVYKRPEDVDVDIDEISLTQNGDPIVMRGKPGRKSKTALNPVTPQIAAVSAAREDHLADDSVSVEITKDPESDDAFNMLIRGMAQEAAVIEFERIEAQRHGQEVVEHAARRARVLKAMADLTLKKRSMFQSGMINMESPQFKALFKYILESFKASMVESGARNELVESIFTNLVKSLDDEWSQEAKRRMREASK